MVNSAEVGHYLGGNFDLDDIIPGLSQATTLTQPTPNLSISNLVPSYTDLQQYEGSNYAFQSETTAPSQQMAEPTLQASNYAFGTMQGLCYPHINTNTTQNAARIPAYEPELRTMYTSAHPNENMPIIY